MVSLAKWLQVKGVKSCAGHIGVRDAQKLCIPHRKVRNLRKMEHKKKENVYEMSNIKTFIGSFWL